MNTQDPNSDIQLNITYQQTHALSPYPGNARHHSKTQIRQIADSIQSFGFNSPILVDSSNMFIAGHGRWKAAQLIGLKEVPIIYLGKLNDAQKRAYILADNRLAEKAGWDRDILAIEFQDLMKVDLGFDLTATGFDIPEIDLLIEGLSDIDEADEDEVPTPPLKAVSKLGDLWILGEHRVYCGNSLEENTYSMLMGDRQAQMVFTDPPYNVPIKGNVSGLGKTKHGEFAMASGEMTPSQFTQFLQTAFTCMANHSAKGSLHFICMDWRHITEITEAAKSVYTELKNLCIWNKDRGGMGSLYRSKHELVFLYKKGEASHINNIELGKHGRNRNNVWNYPAVNTRKTGPNSELAMHPTVKPVRMIVDALMDCSNIGDIVLDPFGGSGSTLMAAERTNRKACLVELSPNYVDTIIQRWQRKTGKEAVHMWSLKTYSQLQLDRGA